MYICMYWLQEEIHEFTYPRIYVSTKIGIHEFTYPRKYESTNLHIHENRNPRSVFTVSKEHMEMDNQT